MEQFCLWEGRLSSEILVVRKLFGDLPDVVVPGMYSELTSRRVLVMEWVEVCAS